jgi:predicted N-formylglutamate amidohydrolase
LKTKIILTCEHANFLTPAFIKQHSLNNKLLQSHRGWDKGAFELSQELKKKLKAELHFFPYSRLYIDANRSLDNKAMSHFCDPLNANEKNKLISLYKNYRQKIINSVQKNIKQKVKTYLFSIHSFTPIFKNKVRKTEIGLLFRPKIKKELDLAQKLKKSMIKQNPKLKVHFNQPYRGFTDCLSNDVLDLYIKSNLVNGLFLELNQKKLSTNKQIQELSKVLATAINQN